MKSIGDPDYEYRPWPTKRRAARSRQAQARVRILKILADGKPRTAFQITREANSGASIIYPLLDRMKDSGVLGYYFKQGAGRRSYFLNGQSRMDAEETK